MRMRSMGVALAALLAGCGGADDGAGAGEEAERAPAAEADSRFEVSADTQRIATPDSAVAPSENPDN
jgi:hypothetical protein